MLSARKSFYGTFEQLVNEENFSSPSSLPFPPVHWLTNLILLWTLDYFNSASACHVSPISLPAFQPYYSPNFLGIFPPPPTTVPCALQSNLRSFCENWLPKKGRKKKSSIHFSTLFTRNFTLRIISSYKPTLCKEQRPKKLAQEFLNLSFGNVLIDWF